MLRILTRPVQPIAPSFVKVLKYSPDQRRGEKGTPEGGRFVRMDWGGMEMDLLERGAAGPPPTHARQVDVDLGRAAVVDQASRMAGSVWAEVREALSSKFSPHTHGAVRAEVKKAVVQDLTERLLKHPAFEHELRVHVEQFVQSRVDQWAESSGDSNLESIQMQRAVKEEFGLADAEIRHMVPMGFGDNTQLKDPKDHEKNKAFVRAEYERTQEFLKSKGLTHVSLFRGVKDDGDAMGFGHETVSMQPASSWTTHPDTAVEFAVNGEGAPKVLTTRVPISEVLSTCVTGRGCLVEEEFVLLGKPTRVQVFAVPVESKDKEAFAPDPTKDFIAKIKRSLR